MFLTALAPPKPLQLNGQILRLHMPIYIDRARLHELSASHYWTNAHLACTCGLWKAEVVQAARSQAVTGV